MSRRRPRPRLYNIHIMCVQRRVVLFARMCMGRSSPKIVKHIIFRLVICVDHLNIRTSYYNIVLYYIRVSAPRIRQRHYNIIWEVGIPTIHYEAVYILQHMFQSLRHHTIKKNLEVYDKINGYTTDTIYIVGKTIIIAIKYVINRRHPSYYILYTIFIVYSSNTRSGNGDRALSTEGLRGRFAFRRGANKFNTAAYIYVQAHVVIPTRLV